MKIILPSAELVNVPSPMQGQNFMRFIEYAARISHGSEESQTGESWKRFIQSVVIDHGDWSVIEHATASVLFKVDRGITHELVRHRLFSFTQSSTRFINYVKKCEPEFLYPKLDVNCEYCIRRLNEPLRFPDGWFHSPIGDKPGPQIKCAYERDWLNQIKSAEDAYKELIAKGWRPQEARSIFPNALASTIQMTGNLRNWRHFFIMRTTIESHPQMRQVTIPLLATFQERIPLIFDDIEPGSRQVDALRKAR